jgi:BirA family transcriptional regulator, biotin operon repressor / biotin---[acetyl-CoA-carboxylase] ligase
LSAGVTRLAEVGSTNDWLLARATDLPDGHWVVADRQTAGRGRRGRAWSDGAGNLMASALVRATGPVQQLSFVAALALREAILDFLPPGAGLVDRLRLKWPNDLVLDGQKVSGILLERSGEALVIGIGVNIAQAPLGISLQTAGLAIGRDALFEVLAAQFACWRSRWAAEGFAPVREAWLTAAAGLGEPIVARLGAEDVPGRFESLADDGALQLRLDDGSLRAIHAGEVFAL